MPDGVRALLADLLGTTLRDSPPVPLDDVALPASSLPAAARAAFDAAVGPEHVADDRESRIRHCRGRSTADLLRLRAGDASDAPDAVVFPADHDEVLAVLEACARHRVAVVPYGGGTSVVGGLTPHSDGFAGVVSLDLRRMASLVDVDQLSSTATVEPGMRGPDLEAALTAYDLTLGHVPQSF
nr:FAD-binding oxidoreductase [Micromonospora sp. DSM 115978]